MTNPWVGVPRRRRLLRRALAKPQRLNLELQGSGFLCAGPADIHVNDVARDAVQSRFAAKAPLTSDRGMRCCFAESSYHTDDILEYRHIHTGLNLPDSNCVSTCALSAINPTSWMRT